MNEKIVKVLNDIAFYEDYKTAVDKSKNHFFQARAYRKAADMIKTLDFVRFPGVNCSIWIMQRARP